MLNSSIKGSNTDNDTRETDINTDTDTDKIR